MITYQHQLTYTNDTHYLNDIPYTGVCIGIYTGKFWYLNGLPHREDGPAVEYPASYKEWYIHGNRHREDGPAIEWADGSKEWFINGKRIHSWKEFKEHTMLSPQQLMINRLSGCYDGLK